MGPCSMPLPFPPERIIFPSQQHHTSRSEAEWEYVCRPGTRFSSVEAGQINLASCRSIPACTSENGTMKDEAKTKNQLIAELEELRGEVAELRQQVKEGDTSAVERRLAVERVRAEAMAMRSSDDLLKVVAVMWQEMVNLGIKTPGCDITFVDKEANRAIDYVALENPRKEGISWVCPDLVEVNEDIVVFVRDSTIANTLAGDEFAEENWRGKVVRRRKIDEKMYRDFTAFLGFDRPPSWLESGWIGTGVFFQYGRVGYAEKKYLKEHTIIVQELTEALSLGYLRFLDFQEIDGAQRQLIDEMEKELQTAHDLQMGLMPAEVPHIPGFDFAGRCIPANHVGGDFFQYFEQDDKLALAMADVTGHAMAAAIPVVMFNGILDKQMELGGDLESIFKGLNRSMYRNLDSRTFVCFTMGELDPSTRSFRFSNGGCPYPYHFQATTGEVVELEVDAYPLGVRPDTDYQMVETQLHPGDRVIFCSDGITEAENASGEQFGYDRTSETILKACEEGLSAEATIDRILEVVDAFKGDAPQGDDMTCVVVRVEGAE